MRTHVCLYIFFAYLSCQCSRAVDVKKPTVLIYFLARNKAHTLPYFLTLLENLNYPKDRISLWIRSDHNVDRTIEILNSWIPSVKNAYHSVNADLVDNDETFPEETGPAHWTPERFDHLISLRESALTYARNIWADYVLAIDCDVLLTNPDTLADLISKNVTVVAPMLKSQGLYSNFWHGWTEDYYYLRTDDYKPILYREKTGCFAVRMVHSCVLINLNHVDSDYLTYVPEKVPNFDGPRDDIITFAISANRSNIHMHLCNDVKYGYVTLPLEQDYQLESDIQEVINIKVDVLNDGPPLVANELLKSYIKLPEKDTLGFDRIFMINLRRRPDRRERMMKCFDELGLDVIVVDAVDGSNLNANILQDISFLPEYKDPYRKRPMTLGEIGCFLSHYNIWKEVADKGYDNVLILEDDVKFESYFRSRVESIMNEVRGVYDWDLLYFGRKRLEDNNEPWVDGTQYLVKPGYSYWTLGYALHLRGARKLLEGEPLKKLLPVDEYIPILFDRHPNSTYKSHFPHRNLVALSAAPLILYPIHYTGEEGYVSDTEDSAVIRNAANIAKDDL